MENVLKTNTAKMIKEEKVRIKQIVLLDIQNNFRFLKIKISILTIFISSFQLGVNWSNIDDGSFLLQIC